MIEKCEYGTWPKVEPPMYQLVDISTWILIYGTWSKGLWAVRGILSWQLCSAWICLYLKKPIHSLYNLKGMTCFKATNKQWHISFFMPISSILRLHIHGVVLQNASHALARMHDMYQCHALKPPNECDVHGMDVFSMHKCHWCLGHFAALKPRKALT